jgi:predicted ATP-grasp superfamily ATP-dependent carboligase
MQLVLHELSYPLIFKPVDGVGASGLSIVKEYNQVGKALLKIGRESTSKRFIAQEFIEGERVSVSLLSTGKKALAASLNKQNMVIAGPDGLSSYEGGIVPFEHPRKHDAFAVAEKVVELFPGLRGYVGVDIILTENAVFVIDVNPRLTTSFVGLHKVVNFNVAEALINSVLSDKLPIKPEIHGVACFSKQEMSLPSNEGYRRALRVSGMVSPPFPLLGNTKACALVMGYGKTCKSACLGLEEAKKQLQDNGSRGEA